jgi:parallel beta-helix repeat protein
MNNAASRAMLLGVVLTLVASRAWALNVDLLSGATGTVFVNQSFNGETRSLEVTVLGASNLCVNSMTLKQFNITGAPSTVGARIYSSGGALLASSDQVVGVGFNQSITIPVSATLHVGQSYRIGFFIGEGLFGNTGDFLDVVPPGFPFGSYIETTGSFLVTGSSSGLGDSFPTLVNAFAPMIEIEVTSDTTGCPCPEDPEAILTRTVAVEPLGGLPMHASLQEAYAAAANDEVIGIFTNTTENVVLDGAKTLKITQCTKARVTASNSSLPVWTVSSTGKLTIIGPDAKDGSIGWLVEGDGHDIKGVRATGASQVGIKITGDNNSVSFNSVSGSPLGVKIEGTGNDVRGGTVSGNSTGVEFSATASNNRFRGAKVRNNTGPGIVVEGPGNTLDGNRVNGNTGDGIHVTATAAGTKLKSNQSGNPENGGAEYRLDVNAVNQGGNRADNIPIPKLSAPQKCAFFAAAGTCE